MSLFRIDFKQGANEGKALAANSTSHRSTRLRLRCLDTGNKRVLLSRIAGSAQARDLSVPPNCGGVGRIKHFKSRTDLNWPMNPLPGLPAARWLKTNWAPVTKAQ